MKKVFKNFTSEIRSKSKNYKKIKKASDIENRVLNLFKNVSAETKREMVFTVNSFTGEKQRETGRLFLKGCSWDSVFKTLSKERNVKKFGEASLKAHMTWVVKKMESAKPLQKSEVITKVIKKPINEKQDYSIGEGKARERIAILDKIKEVAEKHNVNSGKVLTLSHSDCIMEQIINSTFKNFQFVTCENDENTFRDFLKNKKERNLKFMKAAIFGNMEEVIQISAKDTFAHLLLDYCGNFKTFKEELKLAFEKDIVKKHGLIVITLSTRVSIKGFNTKGALVKLIDESGKNRYSVLNTDGYKDTMGMITVIAQRIK